MLIFMHFIILISMVFAKNEDYMGYRVYNIQLKTQKQQDNLHILKSDIIDVWRKPCLKYNVVGQAMVPPSHFEWFEEKLQELGVKTDIFVEDVYEYLNEKEDESVTLRYDDRVFDFNRYYRYNEILDHLYALQEAYTNSSTAIELVEYGVTEQNRTLVYLKLTNNSTDNKPIVIIEAGINPREWITIPAALNIVNRLLEDDHKRFLNEIEWIIIPVLNPDGYEYTHTNLRLWTKSRSTESHLGIICPGVNINRNFDIDWLVSDSSSSPCSHLYGGTDPFSEIETQMVRNLVNEHRNRIRLYISLQNNGGFLTYPWLYEKAASGMFRQHHLLGLNVTAVMDRYTLDVGSVAFGDRMSGTSVDYMRSRDVLYTYNIDIVQKGDGVIIPEGDILSIAEDVWRGVVVAADGVI